MEAEMKRAGGEASPLRTNESRAEGYTADGHKRKRAPLRVMQAEADTLERGAEILALSSYDGPKIEQLSRAIELLLRKEAARVRHRLLQGKSLAELFADEMPA